MNHHTRSYSEQPLIGSGSQIINGLAQQPQPQARILNHSDSQQSLDRLFNPTMTSSVPLRDRNLPSSFFNPTVKTDNGTNGTTPTNGNHIQGNNLHNRSISFGNPNVPQPRRQNFHLRTHSTLAPMPQLDSNHSSHHTSREFLNTTNPNTPNSNNNNNNNNSNNVSLCQQHSENIVSSTSTNNHNHNQQQQPQQRNLHQHSHSSNGWSSAGNSIDDLSSPSWVASPQEPPVVMATNQPMQVVQQHQPTSMHEHPVPIQPHHHHHQQHQMTTNMVANNHQSMFYNAAQQTVAAADTTTTPAVATPNHVCSNHSLHARSVSYHQQRPVSGAAVAEMSVNHGFHQRTHSTIAPMTSTCHHHHQQATSHHSSHQSSREILNHSSATISSAGAGWSGSGYSTDDMTGAGAGHSWGPGNHLHHHPSQPQLHITQQPLPQPPTQMDHQPSNGAPLAAPPLGHNHNHHHHQHHHHHIPLQVQQQTAHPIAPQQQLFYNV